MRVLAARPPYVGNRYRETWTVDLLDLQDQEIAPLDGVLSGSLEFSIHTEVRSAGSITVDNPQSVDWHRVRLRVQYEFTDESGQRHVEPQGVFLPTTPSVRHTATGTVADVDIYDKMVLLATEAVASTWSVDRNTKVSTAVSAVLATLGEDDNMITPDPEDDVSVSSPMTWPPGTLKLRIINDILAAANFFSIWADGDGRWRLDRYVAPASRGVSWTHEAGQNAIFIDEFTHEEDGWAVPNVVIIVGRPPDDETAAPFAVARNDNPNDPYSTVGRGREITLTEEDQDATSETVLGQIAARRLLDVSSVLSTYEIQHAWIPQELNSVTRLIVPKRGVNATCVVQKQAWSWDADGVPSLVSSTLREVAA